MLDFLLNVSAKFKFGVFLLCDTMLAWYMLSLCVKLSQSFFKKILSTNRLLSVL